MHGPARKRDEALAGARYLREPRPLHFPSEEVVPETKRHMMLRTALFQMIALELQGKAAIGSDQFVYWNARDPNRRLAPDVFVCMRLADFVFDSWKTWEYGAPDLAVEIVSATDVGRGEWERKLDRYQEAGIQELVMFDPASPEGTRLRVWDRVEGDLVERSTEGDRTPCATLGLHWGVKDDAKLGAMLRLARDAAGLDWLPTLEEAHERLQHELRKLRGGG